jgi:hypothetical protein
MESNNYHILSRQAVLYAETKSDFSFIVEYLTVEMPVQTIVNDLRVYVSCTPVKFLTCLEDLLASSLKWQCSKK